MTHALIPVDGSDVSLRAITFMTEQIKQGRKSGLILLNVQPPILSGDIKQFVSQEVIDNYHQDEGKKTLVQAKMMLDAAGIPYEAHIKVGHLAETIIAFAKEKHCHSIVMGSNGHGAVIGMLLGSVTTKVLALASVPVTIVK